MSKIVHVTSAHSATDTRVFLKECRGLAAAGHEVVLVVADAAGDRWVDGVLVRSVGMPRSRGDRMLRVGWACVRQALRERGDVLHFHDPELLPWAHLLRRAGKRVVYDMHEFVPAQIETKPWITPRLRSVIGRAWRSVERQLLRGVPVVFAARSLARDYAFVGRSAIVENMPLVEELLGIREQRYDRFTLGYMGSLTVNRGSLQLLTVVERLREEGMPVHLECVGSADDAPTREALRGRAGRAETGVRWHGRLAPIAGWRVMARCHAGLALLLPEPRYLQAYPTKLFEYMGLGLPVIASDFPLYRAVVDGARCGLCVDPLNQDALCEAIRWCVTHPEDLRAMGERGRLAVEREYNWRTEEQRLLGFYAALGVPVPASPADPSPEVA
jgi:glycosyltransferase involved in cell wall biosynthesis